MNGNRLGYPTYVLQAGAFLAGAVFFCYLLFSYKMPFWFVFVVTKIICIVKRAQSLYRIGCLCGGTGGAGTQFRQFRAKLTELARCPLSETDVRTNVRCAC